ncbi:putative Ig domain-containing protein [Pectobacterium brasiliense]|uniref:putative Ig domain-containing protein n=1 Tax=Pectobacterium brasiliense TaxID=180957 RepID=UPI001CE1F32A|nr:putative Ig domain-containing protein [Pectobacterium brasiliense]MCA5919745.1 putative Ig domain-containing protein [Pectobacterium brasiliense]MCA5929004.1 putative Ig domain-containing protein [Pectobacterium brasiliense]MCA5935252.1 putative Ig domain-containing protein [Pectobacterium brasiliense]MCA5938809.1 putative Ig domain-containing protein [Pectobacterium brasiliense]MCA5943101.1 putative Ig domain-containing protein [Pectobacterium brasiliense]
MQWRHFFSSRSKRGNSTSDTATALLTPLGYALEARMMFDGAVAATVNQADAGQNTSEAAQATNAASNDSAHAKDDSQTHNDNQTNNGQDDHAVTQDNGTSDLAVAGEGSRKEVVFIDTSLTDYQTLVDNVPTGIEVVLLDGSKDGLSQLAEWAKNHSGYDAIHVLSHGGEGELQLGTLTLDSKTADARAADLTTLGSALTESGDLLLYGCEVAQNSGQSFVSLLAQITGADIAASNDTTGQGGDWNLEIQTGIIEAATLHIDSYQHALNVSNTDVSLWIDGVDYGGNPVGPGSEIFMDLAADEDHSNWYIDIDPTTSTITMTIRNDITTIPGLTTFDLVFNNRVNGTLLAVTSITADSGATTSAADLSASVTGTDTTITFHVNTDETGGNGVLVWHFTSTNTGGNDTAPSVTGTGNNPTYTENGSAVTLFNGVSALTNDSGQTFTGATLTITNVADSTEYLNINGIKVSLINGNSVALGSGYGSANISLSAGTAIVSLSGATLSDANMSSLLSGMTYGNSSENPSTTARTVTLTQLTDSGSSNNTTTPNITSSVSVVAVNDAPTDLAISNTTFGQSLGSNGIIGTLSATDVDSTTFTYSLVSGVGSTDNALFTLSGNTLRAVNAATMAAGTYSVRLQVSDGQATYEKVVTLTVADDIAPTFDATPTITAPTVSGFTLNTDLNERGTIYYVVLPDGASAPSVTQVINGQNAAGSTALASGSQVSSNAPYSQALTLTGLAAATAYDVYVVARDSAGNATVSVVKLDATTTAPSQAPTLSATGSNPVFIGGMAGAVDLFSGVSADTRDSGQTFNSLTLTVSNVSDSGEFISVAGNTISLASNGSGTLTGIGSYTVTRVGNTVTLQLSGMSASNTQFAGLVDGLRYGNSNSSVTAATRDVSLTAVRDSGTNNNTTSLSLTSSVNVLASNSALYVTSGDDTGDDASFGNSLQDDLNDGGGLSLREALHWANQTPGIDRIVFQTNVTLAEGLLVPTSSMLIDGQNFTLNGGGYSGFQINTSSITLAIQNLTLTNFTTSTNQVTGGVLGIHYGATDINFRLYNVDISGNTDDTWGTGMIDLFNIAPGRYIVDLDRVNIHNNVLFGGLNEEGVVRLFVAGTQHTVSLSVTNSAIYNNGSFNPASGNIGVAGIYATASLSNATSTHISLMNTTITGQDAGLVFGFTGGSTSWVASVRNSIISGNTVDVTTFQGGSYTLNGNNNLIGGTVDRVAAADPRLAASATNAINQGDRFSVTGDTDARGLDRVRQGAVDIGAYESQFASGVSPQVDLNGASSGNDYSATVSSGLSTGVPITDMLATLSQTDGDTRLWTLTLSLAGNVNGSSEYLTLSQQALLAAHAAGINVSGDGSQTVTLTGGATLDAFQTALRAIVYVNVATTPTAGNRTISVTANDDASSSATSTLTVVVGNPPVVAAPIPAQSIAQDGSLSFTVPAGTFTDPDGDTLTLSATLANGSPLPSWLTFNPATGTFTGTPGNADVGSLSIKVTATDTTNASVSTTFSLTVTNVNDAPIVATPIPAQSVAQDDSLSFTVPAGTFTDPDGDTLSLSATLANGSALPSWLTFNSATGTFSGTPGNADVGTLSIKVIANDGNASVSTTFSLTITNVNDAPMVSATIPAQSVAQDGSLNFTVPAGTFTDPDGDTLTLSATLANGSPLPSWLTFNPATGTFTGTPGNSDVGTLSIKVTANDGSASVSTTFSLAVTNVNDAPVVATPIPAQSVAQDGSLNFAIPAGTFTDPDGDTLSLSATLADGSPLPGWITFNPATGTFSGTPGNADVGTLSIKVTATDTASAAVSTTFSLTVTNVNDAPVVGTPIPPQSVAQDGGFNFTVPSGTFSDPDGDTLTLSATLANGLPLPSWISFNPATGTFSGTPGNTDVGSLSIRVTATDGSNASVHTDFSLTITNVNDAPVVATPIPAQSVAQDGSLNFTVPPGTFTDPDGDTLTLSATLADGSPLPSWITFNPATGTFSGTPGNADVGSLSIRVTATDSSNASVHTDFSLTITNVNDVPVVATPIPPQSVVQDGSLSFTVPSGTFTDPDGDTLTLSATLADGSPLPGWITFNPATGTFSGTPGNSDIGNLSIKVTANDGDASISTTFSLTVTPSNQAPVVSTPIPPQSVAQDGGFNFTVPSGTFSDPDGDTLTLSATLADGSPLPSWITFNPATGTFSGTPGNSDVGTLVIRVTATDGSNTSISTSFGLTVTNVNDAPVVGTPIPAQSVAQDGGFNFTVPAGTFIDPDGDTLTLSATLADGSPLPSWITFNPATGTFSGTPGNSDVGTLVIRVTATDGSNTSVSTSFGLTVTNVNDAPVVGTPIPPQSVAQDGGLNFTVPAGTFIDPDGDTLTLSATLANGSPLPGWITFNPATGTFSGTPGNSDVGTLVIRVTATDGSNTSVSTNFGLTVTNVNDAPVVGSPIPPQSVVQDGGFNFTVPAGTFSDPDGDTLTLSATLADGSPLPSWITFNPATGTFSGTPGNSDVGTLVIRVTATDGSNTSISTSFGLTVTNVNDAPVVGTPIPPQSVVQDGGFNFTVPAGTFIDPDGDTLTLSATLADGSPLPSWITFNPATGTFSGTPGNGDVGTLVIRVTATDGSNTSVSTSFGLTVTNVNDAPVVGSPIPPQSVAQDGGFNFTVPAGTFIDPDGDTLTLSATLANGSPLPSWITFNPATGTFSGTPGNGDVGTLVIRVTATDGSNTSISTSFGLTVTNVNDAPVVGSPIPPQSVVQDGGFNFTVPAGTFIDPDGDTLTLSASLADGSPLPSWLRFDPAIGTFSGTPGNSDVGNLVIRITATDGSNTSISTSFGLTVTRSIVGGDPQFKANDGLGRTPSFSDTRQLSTQDVAAAEPTLGGLITNPSLGSLTVGNDSAPRSVMSAIFATGRQNAEGGTLPTSQVAGTFGRGVTSGIGVNFDSTLGSFPSFSKDPALGGTSSLASTFSGIYLPSLTPMEVFSGGSWKDIPLDRVNSAMNSTDDNTGRSVAFTPSLHRQLQQIGDSELQRLAAIEQALQESGQQQG